MRMRQWLFFVLSFTLQLSAQLLTCATHTTPPHKQILRTGELITCDDDNALYYIQRLSQTKHLLSYLNTKNYQLHTDIVIKTNTCILYNDIAFDHYKIVACIYALNRQHSLEPLIALLREAEQYRQIQSDNFIKELLMLIIITYKEILLDTACSKHTETKKSVLETIINISHKLDQLPIAELLNAIDMLTQELPRFLEKYEFHSDLTWKEWLKKYWWIPPVIVAWFGLKVLVEFQHRPFHYFPPYKPHVSTEVHNDNAFINSLDTLPQK